MKRTQTILPAPKMPVCTWGVTVFIVYVSMFCLLKKNLPFHRLFHMFYLCLDVRRPLHFLAPLRGQRPGPSRTQFWIHIWKLQLSMKCAKQMHLIFCSHFCSLHIGFTYLELMILLFSFISVPKNDIHALAILNPEALFTVSPNSSYFRVTSFLFYSPFDSSWINEHAQPHPHHFCKRRPYAVVQELLNIQSWWSTNYL